MGTMYETCAISSLPIVHKDEVVLFLLQKDRFAFNDWACQGETTGLYRPISLPVYAEFTWDEKFNITENKYVKEECNNLSDPKFFNSILRTHDVDGVDFMFMHRSMYELVLKEMYAREEIGDKFRRWALDFVKKAKTELDGVSENRRMLFFMTLDVKFMGNKFVRFFGETLRLRELLEQLIFSDDELLLQRMVDTVTFDYALQVIRKMWHPGYGRGRQEVDYHMMKKVAEAIVEKENQVRTTWLEENELGEDENPEDVTKTHLWYV